MANTLPIHRVRLVRRISVKDITEDDNMAVKRKSDNLPWVCSFRETARYTGISEYKLRQMLKSGQLPHIKSGKKILILLDALKAQLESQVNSQVALEGKTVYPNG